MKSLLKASLGLLLICSGSNLSATVIRYQAIDLADSVVGQDLWQYRYDVSGLPGSAVGFDVFFNLSEGYQAGDLSDPLAPNGDWTVVLLQPDPVLPDDGRFYAEIVAVSPVLPNLPDTYFSVNFVWPGTGAPGGQSFAIYDANFDILEAGRTRPFGEAIPEPAVPALLLVGLFGLTWFRTRRSQRELSKP
ncbi:PEP-CTERM sorting domain-containing protein [Methylocaldum gracile]